MLRHLNHLISTLLFSHTNTTLTIYDSESFGSAVGSCKLPTMCALVVCLNTPTLHHQIVLAAEDPLFLESGSEKSHTHTYVWEGQLWSTYLVREMTVGYCAFFCLLYSPFCCFPAAAAAAAIDTDSLIISYLIFFSFSYPYTPHSFRSWIGSIHREARLGYGYRKDRVFRDENGYHVCEACAPPICAFDVCCDGETDGLDLLVPFRDVRGCSIVSHRKSWSIENYLCTDWYLFFRKSASPPGIYVDFGS